MGIPTGHGATTQGCYKHFVIFVFEGKMWKSLYLDHRYRTYLTIFVNNMLISCVEDLSYHTSININLHLFGLLLSTTLLVVSLAIFTIFPRLKDFHVMATIKVQ